MTARQWFARLFIGVLVLSALAVRPAPADDYVAGTTVVGRGAGITMVDLGVVECNSTGPSVGGACIPWSGGGVEVVDQVNGTNVAFQVCVDNDGNSFCGGTPLIAGCEDDIVFSHFDDGTFSNPLAAPTSFRSGCPGGFRGWVVFLCQGAHAAGTPHTHEVSRGTVTAAGGGGPSGEFCAGFAGKPYVRSAIPDACVFAGSMQTGAMYNPPAPTTTTAFSVTFTIGGCVRSSATFTGTMTGSCFAATGSGDFDGHPFLLTWAGGAIELTPVGLHGTAGTMAVTPNSPNGQSCTSGATDFIVAGVIAHQ